MTANLTENNNRKFFSDIVFFLLSLFGGVIAGLAFGIVGTFIYLILVFPVMMGGIGGYIINENAKYTKTRNQNFIVLVSFITVLALYVSFHFMRYISLQGMTALQVFGDFSDKSLEAAKVVIEYALEKETGQSGLIGYMLFRAKEGVSIGRIFSSTRLNLGPIFTWIYWLIEIGIIAFITVSTGKKVVKKPFCQSCNSWYTEQKHIGGISASKETELLDLIRQREFFNIGGRLEEDPDTPSIELYLQSCTTCEKSVSFLTITKVKFVNGKLASKEILKATLTPREKNSLLA